MSHSRWILSLPLSFCGTLGMSPSVPAVPCRARDSMGEPRVPEAPARLSEGSVLLHPARSGSPTPNGRHAGRADPHANFPPRLFFHQSWAGAGSRLLQMFGRSPGAGGQALPAPWPPCCRCHHPPQLSQSHWPGAAETSTPGCRAMVSTGNVKPEVGTTYCCWLSLSQSQARSFFHAE